MLTVPNNVITIMSNPSKKTVVVNTGTVTAIALWSTIK